MNEMKGEYIGVLSVKYNRHFLGVMEELRKSNTILQDMSKHQCKYTLVKITVWK